MNILQALSARLWVTCPSCGGKAVSKHRTGAHGWVKYTCTLCTSFVVEAAEQVDRRLGGVSAAQEPGHTGELTGIFPGAPASGVFYPDSPSSELAPAGRGPAKKPVSDYDLLFPSRAK